MSKITDLLLDTMKHAEAGDRVGHRCTTSRQLARTALQALRRAAAAGGPAICRGEIDDLVDEFERIVNGMLMLGDRPARSVDEAVAIGERLSALLSAST